MLISTSACATKVGVDAVRPASCEVWEGSKAAFPLGHASRPVKEWALVTDAKMEAACE